MFDRDEAYDLTCPSLKSDYTTLLSIRLGHWDDAFEAFNTATIVRNTLAADTQAPAWLRVYANDTVEIARTNNV